jgi:hypothetical protein
MRRLYDGQKTLEEGLEGSSKGPGNAGEGGFSGSLTGAQNLDAPPLSPYTSAVPRMDTNLNPRAALAE